MIAKSDINLQEKIKFLVNKLKKVKLLYVGRIKVEKGIFSLLKLIKNRETNFTLSIVGTNKKNHNTIINNFIEMRMS